jgi:HMG-box domain
MKISLKNLKELTTTTSPDMMDKDRISSMIEAVEVYSKKWPKLSASEKKKYQDREEEDKIRYEQHMSS